MKKLLLTISAVTLAGLNMAMAQTRPVRGKVLDEKGDGIPAASIQIKGSQAGTIADENGNFLLEVPDESETLVIEAIGFGVKEVAAGDGDQTVTVTMGQTSSAIDEVMVVAYGTARRESYTGSASTISSKKIEKMPVSSVTKAIEGSAPGLQVTNGTGQPGQDAAIRIRGIGSFNASSAPLIVVDGAPFDGVISSINPLDIDQVSLLKDATATSLYGARGANGVLIITTKKGRRGDKPVINLSGRVGIISRMVPEYDRVSQKEYYELTWEAYRNALVTSGMDADEAARVASGVIPDPSSGEFNSVVDKLGGYNSYNVPNDQLIDPNTGKLNSGASLLYSDDWQKELFRTGVRQDYAVSVSGGSESTDYYFSTGYLKEKGFVKYSDFDRFNARLNVNSQVTSWLKAGLNVSGAIGTQNGFTDINTATSNPFYYTRVMAPIYPVYVRDASGNFVLDEQGEKVFDWGSAGDGVSMGNRAYAANSNLIGSLALDERSTRSTNGIAAGYIEAKFLKHFTFRTNLSANYYGGYQTTYQNSQFADAASVKGRSTKRGSDQLSYTFNQLLTWQQSFGDHNFDVLAGHEYYDFQSRYAEATRIGFPFPGFTDLALPATTEGATSVTDMHRIESYLSRLNYNYADKYYLSASIRTDGSSRFASGARWGQYWSIGGAWRLTKENFLSNSKWLDELKFKISYGTQGNESVLFSSGLANYYAWQSFYDVTYPNGTNPGAIVNTVENPLVKWETNKNFNTGFDFRMFNRLSGTVEYFSRRGADMLFDIPFAPSLGIPSKLANIGVMANRGVELNLNLDAVRTRDFNWNVELNLTHYKNEIVSLPTDSIIEGSKMWKVGSSVYDFYLVEDAGVDPENGDALYYLNETNADGTRMTTNIYGEALANGRTYVGGNSIPDLFGGLTNTFTYKGFDFSFMFTFGLGGKFLDNNFISLMHAGDYGNAWSTEILNRWTPENRNTDVPRLEAENPNLVGVSSRFLVNASYLNLRNVTLGYTLPATLMGKSGFKSARAYFTVDNAFLMSARKGMDPQQSFNGTATFGYPPFRTVTFGVNVQL